MTPLTPERWRQVESLFLKTLERDPAERGAFLDEACAGDQGLRAEVESLVASSRKDSAALSGPAMRRIGDYEIRDLLGAGGMGEVYRAYDTRLHREVAIKVLPAAFTADPARRARFEREARALASLNHSNIGAIYGIDDVGSEHGRIPALVLELIEGETLADRLEREGRLPLNEAVRIAGQIVDALDAAHEKGVVHRDLKPANIKLTRNGTVKVLDFGLAKTQAGALGVGETNTATAEGAIVGTPAYMSPEQARGHTTDQRTDVWAFGCVLFEMVAGVSAFAGKTATDTIAAVIERDPDWSRLPTTTPPATRQLLQRTLEKDPQRRLRDIADARACLADIAAAAAPRPSGSRYERPHPAVTRRALVATAAVAVLTAIGLAVWRFTAPAAAPVPLSRFAIELPAGEPLMINDGLSVAASPDGRYLAFSTVRNGRPALYLRPMDRSEARLVSDDNAIEPFFSPDSKWIAFFAGGKLYKQPIGGGAKVPLADASTPRGGSWADAGFIVFAGESRNSLFKVDPDGGAPVRLTALDTKAGETSHRFPVVLPGSGAVLLKVEGTGNDGHIDVFDIASGQRHVLVSDANTFEPHYTQTGHLLYTRGTSLMAAPFDSRRLEVTGPAATVQQHVQAYNVSAAGLLVYASDDTTKRLLQWIDRKGTAVPLALPPDRYDVPRLSPDRKKVVLHIDDRIRACGRCIWIYDLAGDKLTRLTEPDGVNLWPVWTADGRQVIYAKNNAKTAYDLFVRQADGSDEPHSLLIKPGTQLPRDVSKDGVLVYGEGAGQVIELWQLPLAAGAQPHPFVHEAGDSVAFSPDGRSLAYTSRESGEVEVYVGRSDGSEGKWPVSTGGGTDPRWNPNGRELFYRQGNKLVAVSVASATGRPSGAPQVLFENPAFIQGIVGTNYDVDADGKRFLAVTLTGAESSRSIQVTAGWFSELNALSPAK